MPVGFSQWCLSSGFGDIEAVRRLDKELSSSGRFEYEQDTTGRFERALTAAEWEGDVGEVLVLEEAGMPVAFVHLVAHRSPEKVAGVCPALTVEIAALAVHPDFQGLGRGSDLVERTLKRNDSDQYVMWATVSPENGAMLAVLFKHDFVCSVHLDKFTNEKDRLLLQRAPSGAKTVESYMLIDAAYVERVTRPIYEPIVVG